MVGFSLCMYFLYLLNHGNQRRGVAWFRPFSLSGPEPLPGWQQSINDVCFNIYIMKRFCWFCLTSDVCCVVLQVRYLCQNSWKVPRRMNGSWTSWNWTSTPPAGSSTTVKNCPDGLRSMTVFYFLSGKVCSRVPVSRRQSWELLADSGFYGFCGFSRWPEGLSPWRKPEVCRDRLTEWTCSSTPSLFLHHSYYYYANIFLIELSSYMKLRDAT